MNSACGIVAVDMVDPGQSSEIGMQQQKVRNFQIIDQHDQHDHHDQL